MVTKNQNYLRELNLKASSEIKKIESKFPLNISVWTQNNIHIVIADIFNEAYLIDSYFKAVKLNQALIEDQSMDESRKKAVYERLENLKLSIGVFQIQQLGY